MESDPLLQTLGDIADYLTSQQVEYALIGGLAVTARGEPRSTLDIDLVIGCDVDRGLELVRSLPDSPFEPLFDDVDDVVKTAFLLPLRHRRTSVKVDLALGMTGFEQNAIRSASPVQFGEHTIPVVSAENLVLMKVLAGRPRDMDDVAKILIRQMDHFDWNYVLRIAGELAEAIGQDLVTHLQQLRELNRKNSNRPA